MADTFKLSVRTPTAEVFSGVVSTVSVSGEQGEFGVLPGHVAYITAVKPGVLEIVDPSGTTVHAVGDGFAQVAADKVSIIVSSCVAGGAVDVSAEQTRLASAEKTLLEQEAGDPGYAAAQVDAALAMGRLDAAERSASA